MDPVLVSVAGLGASVVKLLLHASGQDTAAGLVGDAQEGLGLLARLRCRANDRNGAVAKRIEKAVADRVRGMYQECRERGVDAERLDGVAVGVGRLVDRVGADDSLILEAVRFPNGFAGLLQGLGEPIRAELFEWSEQYFDELVGAVAAEYVSLAPWSPRFRIEALKYVMGALDLLKEGVDEVRVGVSKGLENDALILESLEIVKENQNATNGGLPRPDRVVYGARPDVAAGFVERGEQQRLRSLVIGGAQERTVLVGMAGCGKSQLASCLARECGAGGWGLVAWLNASSKDSVRSDVVELARRLGVDMGDNPTQDQAVRRCLDHLQSAEAGDRLVVFDNVERIEDLVGVVPRGVGLRVVATTRSGRGWRAQRWKNVAVGVFPREESVAYLLEVVGSQDAEAADAVAGRLGDLPLAVAQAAATASEQEWTLKRYLERLEKYSSKQTIHPVPGDSYTRDVSSALRMAVDSALDRIDDGLGEVARLQVGALAVLAESGVPTRWIDPLMKEDTDAAESNEDTGADAAVEDADAHSAAEDAHLALTALTKASVVQQSADGGVTMLHRLQAQVLRENWIPKKCPEAFDAAADVLDRADIDSLPRKDTARRRRETRDLIDQLRAVAAQDYSRPLFEHEQARVRLHHAFRHANDLGLPSEALTLRNAVSAVESAVGADHPDTLTSWGGLAGAYESAGRLDKAIPVLQKVLVDRARVLGPNHPHTLASCNNLALAYQRAGRLSKAISLYKKVVADRVRVLGPEHSHTLSSRSNLAYTYQRAGRLNKAILLYEKVLADCVRILGPGHPDTLSSRNNLAGAYELAGRIGDAIPLFEGVLADRVRILGPDHPDTLSSRNNLAGAYESAGRLNDAILVFEEVLADCVRVLGPNHPDTLSSRNNLAYTYQGTGRLNDAILVFEGVLTDRVRVLGPDHPHTLSSRNNLAGAYQQAGRLNDAIPLFEEVLADCVRVLDADHPQTLVAHNNLAHAYHAVGCVSEAITLFEENLAQRLETLGPNHSQTLVSRNNLAYAYREAGRLDEALALFKDTLKACERCLSSDHPLTIQVRKNLEAVEREVNPHPASSPESSEE